MTEERKLQTIDEAHVQAIVARLRSYPQVKEEPKMPLPNRHEAAQAVLRAWIELGRSPQYHKDMQNRLRREWPALANALDIYQAVSGK